MGVLLVTGGSRGLGAGIALLAAKDGWHVAVNYTSDAAAAEKVAAGVREQGQQACTIQADVSQPDQVQRMFDHADRELGPITGLVNSAGISTGIGTIDELDIEACQRMLNINVFGLFVCCRAAVQRMATRHGGSGGVIVNLSSASARTGSPGAFVDYAAGKAAVDTLTIGLAKEQGPHGIRVFGVRPGVIDTDMVREAAAQSPEWLQGVLDTTPNGRIGTVDDVAHAVVWLLSSQALHASGSIIDISGARATQ